MNIPEIVSILVNSGIEPSEAKIEVRMMIEHYCNYSAMDIIRGVPLDYKKLEIVKEKAEYRAKTKLPIQYIMGEAYFLRNKYTVNKDVLIPRGDTEQLALKAIDIIKSNKFKTALDIGTGSGCIACSIAEDCRIDVTAVDISDKAISVADINVKNLKLEKMVKLIVSDLFSNLDRNNKFDVIVSNPPYIPLGTELQTEVTFEPQNALFAQNNGLEFYKKIIDEAPSFLNNGGYILFELGINQSSEVLQMLKNKGFKNSIIEKDMIGIDRVICAQI